MHALGLSCAFLTLFLLGVVTGWNICFPCPSSQWDSGYPPQVFIGNDSDNALGLMSHYTADIQLETLGEEI